MPPPEAPLYVGGRGVASSVGRDAVTACAAVRAGVTRPSVLRGMVVPDPADLEGAASGHRVAGVTDGYEVPISWLRLAETCVRGAIAAGELPPASDAAFWRATIPLFVVPSLTGERLDWPEEMAHQWIREHVVDRLTALLGLSWNAATARIVEGDDVSFASAIEAATAALRSRQGERVLLVAIDSLIDPMSLGWLLEHNRLKTGDAPVGLAPGEAAVCLELSLRPVERPVSAPCVIRASAHQPGTGNPLDASGLAPAGQRLGRALAAGLAGLNHQGAAEVTLVSDMNGENWKSQVWGMAQVELTRAKVPVSLVLPKIQVGEVGAAFGPFAIALAAHAFWRKWLRPPVLIGAVAHDGALGVVVIERLPGAIDR